MEGNAWAFRLQEEPGKRGMPGMPQAFFIRVWENGSWGPKEPTFSNLSGEWQYSPCDLVLGPNGSLHCFAIRGSNVSHSVRLSGGEWSTPSPIQSFQGGVFAHATFDSKGTMHLIVEEGTGSKAGIEWRFYYFTRTAQGTWSNIGRITSIPLFLNNTIGSVVDVLVDSKDTLHLFWIDGVGPQRWMYTRKASFGEWDNPVDITPEVPERPLFFRVKIDSDNNLHVAWTQRDAGFGPLGDVYYMTKSNDGSWGIPLNLSKIEEGWGMASYDPSIALSKQGNVYVAWVEYNKNGPLLTREIRYVERHPGGEWVAPRTVSVACCPGVDDGNIEVLDYLNLEVTFLEGALHMIAEVKYAVLNLDTSGPRLLEITPSEVLYLRRGDQ